MIGDCYGRIRPSVESLGELGDRTIRKVKRRVLPLIVLLYFVAFLDRNNVGFAKLTISEDIGLSATAYGLGAGMFFIGYAIFEIPSNAGMLRFGARKWIARILVTWGFFATVMAAVPNEMTFYIIRFLLGAAEARFFPAIILYLTFSFPPASGSPCWESSSLLSRSPTRSVHRFRVCCSRWTASSGWPGGSGCT